MAKPQATAPWAILRVTVVIARGALVTLRITALLGCKQPTPHTLPMPHAYIISLKWKTLVCQTELDSLEQRSGG